MSELTQQPSSDSRAQGCARDHRQEVPHWLLLEELLELLKKLAVVAQADGTFVIPGVGPGDYRLTANVPAGTAATSPWSLRPAIVSGVDALDVSFTDQVRASWQYREFPHRRASAW